MCWQTCRSTSGREVRHRLSYVVREHLGVTDRASIDELESGTRDGQLRQAGGNRRDVLERYGINAKSEASATHKETPVGHHEQDILPVTLSLPGPNRERLLPSHECAVCAGGNRPGRQSINSAESCIDEVGYRSQVRLPIPEHSSEHETMGGRILVR